MAKDKKYQSGEGITGGKKMLTEEDVYSIVSTMLLDCQNIIRMKSGFIQSGNYQANSQGWKQDANGNLEAKVVGFVNLSALPSSSEVGDVCVVSGKLYICTVAGSPGTWAVVGTQT